MTEMIASVLGTAAWFSGVLVLVLMAALPLLESMADAGHGR
ncbi:hypothetical protein [Pseudonocardia sp. MH-G8]|nr:hypothetical protein [Pseudonocardia sp. MH-G8]